MRVFVVAQSIDKNDPILGFFHAWLSALAAQVESLTVTGLSVGAYDLPANVTVHSLGKERGAVSSLRYTWRLWRLAWRFRADYDVVFAHMNPEYVIAGAPVWKLLGKPVLLWYAHGTTSWRLRLATWCTDRVLTSTEQGYRYANKKRVVIGQGIDTDSFMPATRNVTQTPLPIVTMGRITPAKCLETLVSAVAILNDAGVDSLLTIIGPVSSSAEAAYKKQLTAQAERLGVSSKVVFVGPVPNHELPQVLAPQAVFVNDGNTGSLDKALLEAMACGLMVISSNESFRVITPRPQETTFTPRSGTALAEQIMRYTELPAGEQTELQKALRREVVVRHSLASFTKKIIATAETLL